MMCVMADFPVMLSPVRIFRVPESKWQPSDSTVVAVDNQFADLHSHGQTPQA